MPSGWADCLDKSMDWGFKKAGGFGKFNGWGSATAAGVGMLAVPACAVRSLFTDK